jgi:V8-like Glu-specific endopeptidase
MTKYPLLMILLAAGMPVAADEGMWLLNQFPNERVEKKYGVALSPELLDHLRLASVRVGASGSFVSPNGLIFTNHHVVLSCVQDVSTPQNDYVANGFYAKSVAEEKKCPATEANVLLNIEDISAKVKSAVKADPNSAEGNRQRKAEMARLENECSARTGNNCQSVTLYGGAQYSLYEYKKYTDVRLVFAPEFQIGFFGGDPDNFTYPRYCLDVGFFRVYENGQPAKTPHYLKWSREGVQKGEVVFVSGNPGHTERLLTLAELEYYRDVTYPFILKRYGSAIGALKAYMAKSKENERAAKDTFFGLENSYKAMNGRYAGLIDGRMMRDKREAEKKLRAAIDEDASKRERYAQTWADVAKAVEKGRETYIRRALLESGPAGSVLFYLARNVLRLPEEKAKPVEQRLREFAGSSLVSVEHKLYSAFPVTPSMEEVLLTDYFTLLSRELGASDPLVKTVLDGKTPAEAAKHYVAGTKLVDAAERKRLAANVEAVRASKDNMIRLVRLLDPEARRLRKEYEDATESVLNAAKPKLAEARFAVYGPVEAPDATFTLRISYGQVKGYEDAKGKEIPYATKLGGVYERATGELPYVLPKSWVEAKSKLDLDTPFDFVSTADIIGGNSGSPTVNADGEIVGIVFDGNIESLASNFEYTETQARAVHVASQAVIEALDKVYDARRILEEIGFGKGVGATTAAEE